MSELSWIILILRYIVAGLFLFYGISKLLKPRSLLVKNIIAYKFIPNQTVNLLAITLPFIEVFLGLSMLYDLSFVVASMCLLALVSIFQLAIGRALIKGLKIGCGCGTNSNKLTSTLKFAFLRNWTLLGILLTIYIASQINVLNNNLPLVLAILFLAIIIIVALSPFILTLINNWRRPSPITMVNSKFALSRRSFAKLGIALATFIFVNTSPQSVKAVDCGAGHACGCNPIPGAVITPCYACDCASNPCTQCFVISYYYTEVSCCGGQAGGEYCGTYVTNVGWSYCKTCPC